MTPREKLQLSYELAFYPPRLNELWHSVRSPQNGVSDEIFAALDDASRLQLALPDAGFSSQRALEWPVVYQARCRDSSGPFGGIFGARN